ncbi:MAG TPA: hypothetical protein EYG89_02775 [Bacteroidia bacterium]|nr:hypothetical protein [Bacteroidia bacterium]
MKEVSRKLGYLTEIFGYIITYSFLFLTFLFFYETNEDLTFEGIGFIFILIVPLFIVIFFFGKTFYTLYKSYLNLIENKKSIKSFKLHWYISTLFLIIMWVGFLSLLLSWIITDYYKIGALTLPLIYLPLTIPQVILQYKTFNIMKFPLKLKLQKIINTLKTKTLKTINTLKLKKLEKNEIIITSLIVGALLFLLIGNIFPNIEYYLYTPSRMNNMNDNVFNIPSSLKKVYDPKNRYNQVSYTFNYALAIGSSIISGGITYLFLKRINENKN